MPRLRLRNLGFSEVSFGSFSIVFFKAQFWLKNYGPILPHFTLLIFVRELLRSRSPASNGLVDLSSAQWLFSGIPAAGLVQALAYIRLLQTDLPVDAPVENTEHVRGSS